MSLTFTRRDALRWASSASMATTFLPMSGRNALWAHPAGNRLLTRPLGRTGREVTTFGLAGGNKVMWDLPGDEGVEIVVKAVRMGLTFLETANNYQLSQRNYHKAFRILNLIPGEPGYDQSLRGRLFLATKTGLRSAVIRDGSKPVGRSAGGGATCVDDLMRSLTQFFGDGKGYIPEGAYIDLMQIHSLTHESEVDVIYEGLENPGDKSRPRIGAIAGLADFRDGTNLTGLNPGHKRYIRHLGITGHENPTVHMAAIRRDSRNHLDTLLVAINPNDRHYFCHQTNSVPVAAAKGMGIIGMKIFADGVMYGLERKFAGTPGQSVLSVGKPGKVSYEDFLQYSLSGLHGTDTNFFQRTASGLIPPGSVTVERAPAGGVVKVSWSTAYAAGDPIDRYEIYRREDRIATIPFAPQTTDLPFSLSDNAVPAGSSGGLYYT